MMPSVSITFQIIFQFSTILVEKTSFRLLQMITKAKCFDKFMKILTSKHGEKVNTNLCGLFRGSYYGRGGKINPSLLPKTH